MKIILEKAGKKFYREWIFRNLDLSLSSPEKIAVLGPNGSGKSTFLQVLSGATMPTEGGISFYGANKILPETIFKSVSLAAPYMELIEEFTLEEIVQFHFRFKKVVDGLGTEDVINISGLGASRNKTFRFFSSGMKQRVKLVLALLSESEILLLDEPCSNLDKSSIAWYQELVKKYTADKLVVVCSNNHPEEYSFCNRQLNVMDWK